MSSHTEELFISPERIDISLTAKQKGYRLYSEYFLREHLSRMDGELWRDIDRGNWHLRRPGDKRSIVFDTTPNGLIVITQMNQHWNYHEHGQFVRENPHDIAGDLKQLVGEGRE